MDEDDCKRVKMVPFGFSEVGTCGGSERYESALLVSSYLSKAVDRCKCDDLDDVLSSRINMQSSTECIASSAQG